MNLLKPNNIFIILSICLIIFYVESTVLANLASFDTNYFKVKPESFYFNYWELDDNHNLFMKEYGLMQRISLSYLYNSNILYKVEGRFAYGQISYEGSTSYGHPVNLSNVCDYMFEIRELIGIQLLINSDLVISTFSGLGYRNLNDELGQASYLGYKRESNYLYLPLIIQTCVNINNKALINNEFEYDFFLLGIQNSYLSDFNPNYNDVTNIQNQGFGLTNNISFSVPLNNLILSTELFFRYWHIEKSYLSYLKNNGENVGYVWEPENNTIEIGIGIGLFFEF